MSYLSWTCWMYHCIVLTSRTEAVLPSSQSNTCCCWCLVWFVCVFFFFFAKLLIATLPFVLSFKFPMYTSSFGRCCGVSLSLCFYVRQLVCIMLVFLFFNFLSVLVRPNVEPLQWIPSTVPEVRTAVQNFIILFGGTCRCERVDTCFTVSLFEEYSLLWALVASLPSQKLSGNLNGVFSIS